MKRLITNFVILTSAVTLFRCGFSPADSNRVTEEDDISIESLEEKTSLSLTPQSVVGEVTLVRQYSRYSWARIAIDDGRKGSVYFCSSSNCFGSVGAIPENVGLIKLGAKLKFSSNRVYGSRFILGVTKIDQMGWNNSQNELDINGDGCFTGLDLKLMADRLRLPNETFPTFKPSVETPFYDVDNDGQFSSVDVLRVINNKEKINKGCGVDKDMIIFVSSERYSGAEIGGLNGADQHCTELASSSIEGAEKYQWVALLSDDSISARSRLTPRSAPMRNIVNVAGAKVADNKSIWNGSLGNAIRLTENGQAPYHVAHTGTNFDGSNVQNGNCSNWTSNSGASEIGRPSSTDQRWVDIYSGAPSNACSNKMPIYCVGK